MPDLSIKLETYNNPFYTPIIEQEEGFSSLYYLEVALVIGALAAAAFAFYLPAAVILAAVAARYLWSAAVILLNRAALGTCIETPIHRLYAVAMEVNSIIAAALVFPLTFFPQFHAPQGDPAGKPILMVNGYLSYGSTWYYLRSKLVEAGFGPIYTMNVGSGSSIETYAEQVREKALEIQQATGKNDLILINHSKGGLVSSYYATHLAAPKTKLTVVNIGSPFEGTPIAYLGFGDDAYEMRPGSEFHEQLRQKMKEHSEIRFFDVATKRDEIVPLSSALSGENRVQQLVINDLGHLSLIFSSRVANQICAWL